MSYVELLNRIDMHISVASVGELKENGYDDALSNITVTVPCVALPAHPNVATAIVALVTSPGGSVVSTASFDNSATSNPNAVFTLSVPSGTPAGSYRVTSSCDTYMSSVQYAPVPFTVT